MKYPDKIDLHMHSTVSDGTDTPAEILSRVRKVGIRLFALTDHDALKGCKAIIAARKEGDPAFMTGVEFSCMDENGKYHILGYGYDPNGQAIGEVIEQGHSYRIEKLRARLDFLKARFGFGFSEEEEKALFALDNPGKPHLGNLMVQHGYAETKNAAIKEYIDQLQMSDVYISPEQAIRGILQSGGIPVLAHPSYGDGDQLILGEEMEARIARLKEMGLQGLETYYSGFTNKLRSEILSFAEQFDLYVTAGSDYHGKNKLIALGDTELGAPDEWPKGLRAFLDDVRSRCGYEA